MPKSRPPCSPEFRRQMVDLVRAGRSPDDLASRRPGPRVRADVAFDPRLGCPGRRQEGRREEAAPGLATAERDELARLRREVRQLRLERDVLSKAAASPKRAAFAAVFAAVSARETGTLPSGCSGS